MGRASWAIPENQGQIAALRVSALFLLCYKIIDLIGLWVIAQKVAETLRFRAELAYLIGVIRVVGTGREICGGVLGMAGGYL